MASATVRAQSEPLRRELISQLHQATDFPVVVRLPFHGCPLEWLRSQNDDTRLLWGGRDDGNLQAAAGTAWQHRVQPGESLDQVIHRCRSALPIGAGLRCFGGFAFRGDNRSIASEWSEFGAGRFVIPQAVVDGDTLRILLQRPDDLGRALTYCDRSAELPDGPSASPLPGYQTRVDQPDYESWKTVIQVALRQFEEEVLEKIVLARCATFQFEEPLDSTDLLHRLIASTKGCFHFLFQFGAATFLGATPERLFRRTGNRLFSEVIAGTRIRGETESIDRQLADQLLRSSKDQLEHDVVRKSIRQRLYHYVDQLKVDEQASILRLTRKQHLISRVEGRLKQDISDGQLLERLHPTPAVGGYPTEIALREIDRLECFDRGWYAAPVGWISEEESEFAVAIRSGLIMGDQLSLYSGAGIVPGSTAQAEWQEIEHKISDFLDVMQRSC